MHFKPLCNKAVLLPEFTLLPYAAFIDKLRFSADEADYSQQNYIVWETRSITTEEVFSSAQSQHHASLLTENDIQESDFIVFFGGRNVQKMLELSSDLRKIISLSYQARTHIVAVDNAIFALGDSLGKLASGNGVTVHWRHRQQFESIFPQIPVLVDKAFYIGQTFSSCVGGVAVMDLAIELLSPFLGQQLASKGLSDMMTEQHRSHDYIHKAIDIPIVRDQILHQALISMNDQLFSKTSIESIAKEIGMSRRQLDRKFITEFNLSAHEYFKKRKLDQAKWLIKNTSMPIVYIANLLGFESLGYFRSQYKKMFGNLPSLEKHDG
ncbi:hypothetical protein F959_02353 [Acinetobacter venetianus RAG-1 = CIP 110063]|uniref:HTH araC/xylS-type domain-containing protein n=2 Tax=Acinetobacter venetianus TaxID=52133 RepID=N8YJ09_ACIVR|nr:helix-turn-helix domain-containing protein [Acinetobacter venetianus]ENV36802.1 hypothetical protein F959_02353 [Acinetobacter venetianus RAG-1 = CIP 110063]